MTSRKFVDFLTPSQSSVMLKWLFYLELHTERHKSYIPPPLVADVIYERSKGNYKPVWPLAHRVDLVKIQDLFVYIVSFCK